MLQAARSSVESIADGHGAVQLPPHRTTATAAAAKGNTKPANAATESASAMSEQRESQHRQTLNPKPAQCSKNSMRSYRSNRSWRHQKQQPAQGRSKHATSTAARRTQAAHFLESSEEWLLSEQPSLRWCRRPKPLNQEIYSKSSQ